MPDSQSSSYAAAIDIAPAISVDRSRLAFMSPNPATSWAERLYGGIGLTGSRKLTRDNNS